MMGFEPTTYTWKYKFAESVFFYKALPLTSLHLKPYLFLSRFNSRLQFGRPDSNRRPLDPKSSALARLSYSPLIAFTHPCTDFLDLTSIYATDIAKLNSCSRARKPYPICISESECLWSYRDRLLFQFQSISFVLSKGACLPTLIISLDLNFRQGIGGRCVLNFIWTTFEPQIDLVPQEGLEPSTHGLRVRCATNCATGA